MLTGINEYVESTEEGSQKVNMSYLYNPGNKGVEITVQAPRFHVVALGI